MSEESEKFIQRANDCLSDAEANLLLGRLVVAVNRSYYCMFDCARSLLADLSLQPKTHQGVYVKFNEFFVKNGKFSNAQRDNLRAVFEMRQSGDYDPDYEPTLEDATFAVESAREFLSETRAYFIP